MGLVSELFTWWNGQTMGTRFYTWRKGERVGTDEFGNTYYRERRGDRRWVIYNGPVEGSRVPPEWHAWLHRTVDQPPGEGRAEKRPWERPHQPNMTGTPQAYRPPGSTLRSGERRPATGDYEAWTPAE